MLFSIITDIYADTDGDGYGDPNVSSYLADSCDPMPDGYVSNNEDCDDTDSSINPGATDTADNGIDEDCSDADSTSTDDPNKSGSGAEEAGEEAYGLSGGCGCDIFGPSQINATNSIFLILLLALPAGIMLVLRKKRNSRVSGDDNNLSWGKYEQL